MIYTDHMLAQTDPDAPGRLDPRGVKQSSICEAGATPQTRRVGPVGPTLLVWSSVLDEDLDPDRSR